MKLTLTDGHVAAPIAGDARALEPSVRATRNQFRVAFVAMPFYSARTPSIQIGLLKSIAASHGFAAATFHFNVDFAVLVGDEKYEALCQQRGPAFGEWLFSAAAFGSRCPDPHEDFLSRFHDELAALEKDTGISPAEFSELRRTVVPRFVDQLIDTVPWPKFDVVGFSSTFQQNTASVALASAVKRRYPGVTTLFGGSNFDGQMGLEYVRAIDSIDYAIAGEADEAVTQFLIRLSEGSDPAGVPGVIARRGATAVQAQEAAPVENLDTQPVPDYSEYFARATALDLVAATARREVQIPVETSRGCWWGARRHCTFCGLNGTTMRYRAKSPEKASSDLAELVRRHRSFHFCAVDNILDTGYLETLLPHLRDADLDYQLFYEVKANLKRAQLQLLRDAGVIRLQPGIESLSSHVLQLMRKGTRAVDNVNLLRWATHIGIEVCWNLLWGFPDETLEDYEEQAALMDNIVHLQPARGSGRIWMERFSPLFIETDKFPCRTIRPEASYSYIYPSDIDLEQVAYFFEYELETGLPAEAYSRVSESLERWQALWRLPKRPALSLWKAPGLIQIEDERDPEARGTHTFEDPLASLYLACFDEPATVKHAATLLSGAFAEEEVSEALDEFVARGLMMRDRNLYLSLAVPATGGGPPVERAAVGVPDL